MQDRRAHTDAVQTCRRLKCYILMGRWVRDVLHWPASAGPVVVYEKWTERPFIVHPRRPSETSKSGDVPVCRNGHNFDRLELSQKTKCVAIFVFNHLKPHQHPIDVAQQRGLRLRARGVIFQPADRE